MIYSSFNGKFKGEIGDMLLYRKNLFGIAITGEISIQYETGDVIFSLGDADYWDEILENPPRL